MSNLPAQREGGPQPAWAKRSTKGFTLVELLVVLAIISMLAGLLVPSLGSAMKEGKSAQCVSNLRQMAIAAQSYAVGNNGYYPLAYERNRLDKLNYEWDITMVNGQPVPGLLWEGGGDPEIHQCPAFEGDAKTLAPYSGYNYNASYIGGYRIVAADGRIVRDVKSAELSMIQNPSECALFGDGEYGAGANKFMRAPKVGRLDVDSSTSTAGTQGFRHNKRTNVAFADGHVASFSEAFVTVGAPPSQSDVGFLSPDNRLYDLE